MNGSPYPRPVCGNAAPSKYPREGAPTGRGVGTVHKYAAPRDAAVSLTLEQLVVRKDYIGASEAAAACGLSPWKTPYELWADKTSAIVIEQQSARMEWGNRLEAVVMLKYLEDLPPEAGTLEAPCQFQVSAEYPWMGCTPDGLLPDRVVEIKTAGLGQAREWGEPGTDAVPLQYLLQCTHQMIVCNRRKADIPVLIGGNDYRVYSVDLDEELANLLITREREFWQHVENKTPPEVKHHCRRRLTLAEGQRRQRGGDARDCRGRGAARRGQGAAGDARGRRRRALARHSYLYGRRHDVDRQRRHAARHVEGAGAQAV